MGNKLFKRGYEVSREEKKRQDIMKENRGKKLFEFYLVGDGAEAQVRFLTEEPVNCNVHQVNEGGKYKSYLCTDKNCPFCADGDRPSYKGAYLVIDRREFEYTDKDGKKQKGKNQLRLYLAGMRVVSQLDRTSQKYGLSNREVNIVRLGKGTSTTYTIEKMDEESLTEKEIISVLPEKLKEEYDGTVESLYNIVEEQLLLMRKDVSVDDVDDEDEDDGVEEDNDARSKLISVDDEEEEEEKPRKKMFKRSQNSVKPRVKSLIKKD